MSSRGRWTTGRGGVPISRGRSTRSLRAYGGWTLPRGNGSGSSPIGSPGGASRCFPRRGWRILAATLLRRKAAVSQAPHVDPILEIGRGAEVGSLFAAIGRNHLAQHAGSACRRSPRPTSSLPPRQAGGSVPSRRAARRGSFVVRATGPTAAERSPRARRTRYLRVVKVRRIAVGCGANISLAHSSGTTSASMASLSGSASGIEGVGQRLL